MQTTLGNVLSESRAFTRWMIERIESGVQEDLTWEGVLVTFAMACQTAKLDAHKLLSGSEKIAKILIQAAGAVRGDELPVTTDEAEKVH